MSATPGVEAHVPAFPCEPQDLTGAGRHVRRGVPVRHHARRPAGQAARAANFLAMKVITQVGARLHHGTKSYWEQALADA